MDLTCTVRHAIYKGIQGELKAKKQAFFIYTLDHAQ